jgi:hypothetical protein
VEAVAFAWLRDIEDFDSVFKAAVEAEERSV